MKKAQVDPLKSVGSIILVLILVGVMLFFIVKYVRTPGQQLGELSPQLDSLCLTRTQTKLITSSVRDIDNDKRDDDLCDWCVCTSGCHNDNDDVDGDKLPKGCDEDDALTTGKDKTSFLKSACTESSLISLGKTWGKQCRPS